MKTVEGLINYAEAMVGKPYWFGTHGETATKDLYARNMKDWPHKYGRYNNTDKDFGNRVHDAPGLIKGYLWSDTPTDQPKYNSTQDLSSYGFYRTGKESGKRDTFPNKNGVLVFKSLNDYACGIYTVGIYADGYVYEATDYENGVTKTKFNLKDWPFWALCSFLDYGA